jgi:hypothetical protein
MERVPFLKETGVCDEAVRFYLEGQKTEVFDFKNRISKLSQSTDWDLVLVPLLLYSGPLPASIHPQAKACGTLEEQLHRASGELPGSCT